MTEVISALLGTILGYCLGFAGDWFKKCMDQAKLQLAVVERASDLVVKVSNTKNMANGIFLNISSRSPLNTVHLFGSDNKELVHLNLSKDKYAIFVRLDPIVLLEGNRCDFIVNFLDERKYMPDYIRVVARSTNSEVVKCDHPLTWSLHKDALGKCAIHADKAKNTERLLKLRLRTFDKEGDKAAEKLSAMYHDVIARGATALDEHCRKYGIDH